MAFTLSGNNGISRGIYNGQTRKVNIGAGVTRIKPSQISNEHYLGFRTGSDYVTLNAFYDSDQILGNRARMPKMDKISYVQLGQIKVDGVPVPIHPNQRLFPQRNAKKFSPSGAYDPNRDFWWIDVTDFAETLVESILFPWEAQESNLTLSEDELFIFPQTNGCFVRRTLSRLPNESLCASAISRKQLKVPVPVKQNNLQDMLNLVSRKMKFDQNNFYFTLNDVNLGLVVQFFSSLWVGLTSARLNAPMVDVPKFQLFSDPTNHAMLVIRSNFIDGQEVIYPILFSPSGNQVKASVYMHRLDQGYTDNQIQAILNVWLPQQQPSDISLLIETATHNSLGSLVQKLAEACQSVQLPLSGNLSFQPIIYYRNQQSWMLLVRDNFLDGQEYIYAGMLDRNSPNTTAKFYDFDQNAYADLLDGKDFITEIDPFNLDYSQEVGSPSVFDQDEFTFTDLENLFRQAGMNLPLNPDNDHIMEYNIIDGIMVVEIVEDPSVMQEDTRYRLYPVEAFLWNFRRSYNGTTKEWSDVQFDINRNLQSSPDINQFFQDFITRHYQAKFSPNIRPEVQPYYFNF